jgi:putative addiction module component (TIGR02574 family)
MPGMSSRARKILQEALGLPEEDRLLIAAELRNSADAPPEEVEEAWRAEVMRRLKSIEDGTAVLHEWEDVERELLDIVET